MKSHIKSLLAVFFFALTIFSCQDELVQVTPPEEAEAITPNSALTNLMFRTSSNNVSADNVLDNTNCFSVDLPVTVEVSDITITITTQEDLEELEDILEDLDDELPEFIFPITIIYSDYSQLVIESQEQLDALLEDCFEDDDVIECIDFVYPISFSVFDTDFVIIDTITINNDEALYEFLDNLEDNNQIVGLNFPVTLQYANGDTLEVNSNLELSNAIESAGEDCGETTDICNPDEVEAWLKECKWVIETYTSFPEFEDFKFQFNEDFTFDIIIDDNQVFSQGNTWQVTEDNGIVYLSLTTEFEDFGGNWEVVECDDDELYFVKDNQTMEIEKYCEEDVNCNYDEISASLQECEWYGESSVVNGLIEDLIFTADGEIKTSDDLTVIGSYSFSIVGAYTYIDFMFNSEYQNLTGQWKVVECEDEELQLIRDNDSLYLEQDCEQDDNDIFECFDAFDAVIAVCDDNNDGVETVDLTIAFANCTATDDFEFSFYETSMDADNEINSIANPEAYTNVSNPQTVYIRVDDINSDEYEIFEIDILLENCTTHSCTEEDVDGTLMNCVWIPETFNGDDHLDDFELLFGQNQELVVTNTITNETVTGNWYTEGGNNGEVFVFITGVAMPEIQAINLDWTVVECSDEQFVLQSNNTTMVLEKECD